MAGKDRDPAPARYYDTAPSPGDFPGQAGGRKGGARQNYLVIIFCRDLGDDTYDGAGDHPEIPAFNSIFISGNDTPSRERTSMAAWLSRGLTTKLGLVGFSFGIAC